MAVKAPHERHLRLSRHRQVVEISRAALHEAAVTPPGDPVTRDESLVELETDKVVLEVPAPVSGVLREIRVQNGTTVRAGELLALLEPAATQVAAPGPPPEAAAAAATGEARTPHAGKTSPAVRRLLAEQGRKAEEVSGSGRGGRILKSDVDVTARPAAPAPQPQVPSAPVAAQPAGGRAERRVPMSRLRARIAERMVEAQQTAAMLTTFNEVDLSEVLALRARHKDAFAARYGVKLGLMSFFVKACVEALRRFPVINASVEGNEIIYHDYVDMGIAVSTDRGLIVPVLRDAGGLGFAEIEQAIGAYSQKARDGTIAMEDLMGGTFTITNGGVFGSLLSTPILNPPQSGILGMHKIQDRPVVVDGEVKIRPMMYLALTYDHRIID
ncbi:MAG: 2-oxoglutarate dehydrogenase complex dihydrolipoyllysine-residue succinyltransferase, partial [Armatimonadota bacterium]|nr:2-oxoglutarate dehydrogenase complex dihydrolipoyllysine-residue succinyltransferase [Armatimonadota bacterium]